MTGRPDRKPEAMTDRREPSQLGYLRRRSRISAELLVPRDDAEMVRLEQ